MAKQKCIRCQLLPCLKHNILSQRNDVGVLFSPRNSLLYAFHPIKARGNLAPCHFLNFPACKSHSLV